MNAEGGAAPDTDVEVGGAFAPNASELVSNNAAYAEAFSDDHLPVNPRRQLAVVACMDSRMDIFELLGLTHGEAHIIRNAGGVITDDVIRSLAVSQRRLGTRGHVGRAPAPHRHAPAQPRHRPAPAHPAPGAGAHRPLESGWSGARAVA